MVTMKLLIVFGVLGLVFANDDLRQIDSIKQEPECISFGGMCTIAADCPKGQLAVESGLCPDQLSIGVECCHGISVKETRCRKRGGECLQGVNLCATLRDKKATDCPRDSTCCIIV